MGSALRIAALLTIVAGGIAATPAEVSYVAVEVGPPGGDTEAFGVNDRRQVVGDTWIAPFTLRPFLWENGVTTVLGILPGGTYAVARDINNAGDVVGFGTSAGSGEVARAILWRDGHIIALDPLPGASGSAALAINDAGIIAGGTDVAAEGGPEAHATLWLRSGEPVDLGTLLGSSASTARDVNNRGQVVGQVVWNSHSHAFLWERGRTIDIGALPGDDESGAVGINDSGQVVGVSSSVERGTVRGFLWENGVMRELGVLPGSVLSYPTAIGKRDLAAGVAVDTTLHPIVFSRDGITQLPTLPGALLSFVNGANRRADVVGSNFIDGVRSAGVIWMRRP
jgi:probable HAF family extracellular repeat protein